MKLSESMHCKLIETLFFGHRIVKSPLQPETNPPLVDRLPTLQVSSFRLCDLTLIFIIRHVILDNLYFLSL